MKTPAWLTLKVGLYIGGAILVILALVGAYRLITANPKAEARLARNQSEAAAQSGADAVNTVADAAERDAASDELTRTNEAEIRNAEGADAPVAAPVKNAGLQALCRRAAYRDSPRCVRLRDERADPR